MSVEDEKARECGSDEARNNDDNDVLQCSASKDKHYCDDWVNIMFPSLDTGGKTWQPIFGMKSAAEHRKRVKGQRGPVSQRLELLTETVSYYTLT